MYKYAREYYISPAAACQHKEMGYRSNRDTIEFLGLGEQLYNANFKPVEFEGFRKEAGLNAFTLSIQKLTDNS